MLLFTLSHCVILIDVQAAFLAQFRNNSRTYTKNVVLVELMVAVSLIAQLDTRKPCKYCVIYNFPLHTYNFFDIDPVYFIIKILYAPRMGESYFQSALFIGSSSSSPQPI